MAKFSDFPYFLLKEYFNTVTQFIGSQKQWYSALWSARNLIVARGGYWTPMFVKREDQWHKVLFHPLMPFTDGKFFFFRKSILTKEFEPGDGVYLRKDSFIHDWFKKNKIHLFDDFMNVNQEYLFFGNIYPGDSEGKKFKIEYQGLRNWTSEALPPNIRNPRLDEFFDIIFDRVYHQTYHRTRDTFSLLSPFEIDYKFLPQLPSYFSYPMDDFLLPEGIDPLSVDPIEEKRKRELVKNLGPFLKRKGTYNSLYIIWQILTSSSINPFEIRERWHSDTVTSGSPLPYFEDYNYLGFYLDVPNGIVTGPPVSGDYPVLCSEDGSDEKKLSTHYQVLFDLSQTPLNTDQILNKVTANGLIYNWEMMRPVHRVAWYSGVISPELSLLGKERELYEYEPEEEDRINLYSRSYLLSQSLEGTFIHLQQEASRWWSFTHDLNTRNILVKVFSSAGVQSIPSQIQTQDEQSVAIEFQTPQTGFVFVIEADYTLENINVPLLDWTLTHSLGSSFVHAYFTDTDGVKEHPSSFDSTNSNILEVKFEQEHTGFGQVKSSEYQHTQSVPSDKWILNHNLQNIGVVADFWDSNWEKIFPASVKLINENQTEATFAEPITGYSSVSKVGQIVIESVVIDNLKNGYFKIGSGDRQETALISDIPDAVYQDNVSAFWEDDDFYYLKLYINSIEDIHLREIGLFGADDVLYFYSFADSIWIPKEMDFTIIYKIEKE